MERESLYSDLRFAREWQYIWLEYLANFQAGAVSLTRPVEKAGAGRFSRWLGGIRRALAGRLADRSRPAGVYVGTNEDLQGEAANEAFDWIQSDFNEVYNRESYKGSALGMIANEMQARGVDLNRLKRMSLPDLHVEMQDQGYPHGLKRLDDYLERSGVKESSVYSRLWSQTEGAKWLAVYDESGERKGRAYEIVTKMYRDVVNVSLELDEPIEKLRSRLVHAADATVKDEFVNENGVLDEVAYQAFMEKYLNRDFHRLAVTETAINYNHGLLLGALHRAQPGEPIYMQFVGGGG